VLLATLEARQTNNVINQLRLLHHDWLLINT